MSQTDIENTAKKEFNERYAAAVAERAKIFTKMKRNAVLFVIVMLIAMFNRQQFLFNLVVDLAAIYLLFRIVVDFFKGVRVGRTLMGVYVEKFGAHKLFE